MVSIARGKIAIIGAGPVGLICSIGLKQSGFDVFLVDTLPSASILAASSRSAAILSKTAEFLMTLDVWKDCKAFAAPLSVLQFIDDTKRILRAPDVTFNSHEIGEQAFGYNILNEDLVSILRRKVIELGIDIIRPGRLSIIKEKTTSIILTFENGFAIEADIAIGSDGRLSALRELAGIKHTAWSYDQVAVATSFSHATPHNSACIEIHRESGPFTIVPLIGNRSSLVWVERKAEAERLLSLSNRQFIDEIETLSHHARGQIFDVTPRAFFPLSSLVARDYAKNRVILMGEAAHVTPPIGAQGLNLGFRDAETFLRLIQTVQTPLADADVSQIASVYDAERRRDIVPRTFAVDLLNRSLISNLLPLTAGRGAGLFALSAIGPLRRAFMRQGIAP